MSSLRRKNLITYVVPATLTTACTFLFTVVDGIFVGQGIGSNGLGAVNIAVPFTLICAALFMLSSIGGVTITAIRMGRGDAAGANQAFMHSFTATAVIAAILSAAGVFLTVPIARLLGADDAYLPLVKDYIFWYALFVIPSGLSVNLQSFCRNDGSPHLVAITETVDAYQFDLPEDFDAENEDKFNYFSGITTKRFLRKINSAGLETQRINLSELCEQMGYVDISHFASDGNGNLYMAAETEVAVLNSNQELLFTVQCENTIDQFLLLGDGDIGVACFSGEQRTLRTIQAKEKSWGKEYPLPPNYGSLYTGTGEWLFCYENGESVYGLRAGENAGEKLFSWSIADIDQNQVETFTFLDDGKVAALLRSDGGGYELALLSPTDSAAYQEKTILTFATLSLDYNTRSRIIAFNKSSDKYRIVIRDYSEFDAGDNRQAGLTKLNTEILAGRIPDLLDTSGSMPIRMYAVKGMLENLWPYIEQDPELGRKGVMEHVLQAAEINGKLYQVFSSFSMQTVLGSPKVVGNRMGWTLSELKQALSSMPKGCQIFDQFDTKASILSNVLSRNMNKYVDWIKGVCQFDSKDFISSLKFCNNFPKEIDFNNIEYEGTPARISAGQQMLLPVSLYNFTDIQMYKAMFGGEVTFIGYPTESGIASNFSLGTGMAMSSTCEHKKAAWSVLRRLLLPGKDEYIADFPTNRAAFDKLARESMTPEYAVDEDGNYILDGSGQPIEESKGGWMWDNLEIDLKATSQEEYDQIMALYKAIDSVENQDQTIYEIVLENASAYFSGDRSAEDMAKLIQSRVKLYVGEQL